VPCLIKLFCSNFKLLIGRFYLLSSLILIWATCNNSYKLLFSTCLLLDIGVCIMMAYNWISKYLIIEFINNDIDCWLSPKSLIEILFRFFCGVNYLTLNKIKYIGFDLFYYSLRSVVQF
jgi:hypothetical protein